VGFFVIKRGTGTQRLPHAAGAEIMILLARVGANCVRRNRAVAILYFDAPLCVAVVPRSGQSDSEHCSLSYTGSESLCGRA